MSARLGRFLEISVQAGDVLESLGFYDRLGFEQASTNDVWRHRYAVVTDGRLALGLHDYAFASPALTFVLPELRQGVEALTALGIEFAFCKLGDGVFNEAGFTDPDGHMVALLEARSYSPVDRAPGHTSQLGWFEELLLPVADLGRSQAFWERLGFLALERSESQVQLTSDTLNLTLLQAAGLPQPALLFSAPDAAQRAAGLAGAGFGVEPRLPQGFTAPGDALLRAPDGTLLLMTTRD